jgi:hypothetical protein
MNGVVYTGVEVMNQARSNISSFGTIRKFLKVGT